MEYVELKSRVELKPRRDIHDLFGVQTSDDLVRLIEQQAQQQPVLGEFNPQGKYTPYKKQEYSPK